MVYKGFGGFQEFFARMNTDIPQLIQGPYLLALPIIPKLIAIVVMEGLAFMIVPLARQPRQGC